MYQLVAGSIPMFPDPELAQEHWSSVFWNQTKRGIHEKMLKAGEVFLVFKVKKVGRKTLLKILPPSGEFSWMLISAVERDIIKTIYQPSKKTKNKDA